jgi:flagellar motor switch protein FliN
MAAFTEENIESIIATVAQNVTVIAESLNQCFDSQFTLQAGDSQGWVDATLGAEFSGPGLLAVLKCAERGVVVMLPETLPLPPWYQNPGDSQKARLETLALEWSMNLLPADFECEQFASRSVADMRAEVDQMRPTNWACLQEIVATGADGAQHKLAMVWPLKKPVFENAEAAQPASTSAPQATAAAQATPGATSGFDRLRNLPVSVSVRIAEKRVSVLQLLDVSAGTLITFPKSCDDQLDLYVNNSLYGKGEAVKIGEKFGLKINEVGAVDSGGYRSKVS